MSYRKRDDCLDLLDSLPVTSLQISAAWIVDLESAKMKRTDWSLPHSATDFRRHGTNTTAKARRSRSKKNDEITVVSVVAIAYDANKTSHKKLRGNTAVEDSSWEELVQGKIAVSGQRCDS